MPRASERSGREEAPEPAPERRRREGSERIRGVNLGGYFGVGSGIGQMSRSSAAVLEHAAQPHVFPVTLRSDRRRLIGCGVG